MLKGGHQSICKTSYNLNIHNRKDCTVGHVLYAYFFDAIQIQQLDLVNIVARNSRIFDCRYGNSVLFTSVVVSGKHSL
jgi:hypothetical protein